jgi:type II secretory pathway component PulF
MDQVKIRKRYEEEDNRAPIGFQSGWPYLNIGFGDEKDYFIENLSLLISSGLGITAALLAIKPGLKKRRMIKLVDTLHDRVTSGIPLWKAFEQTRFFPPRVIAIIKAGEDSGRLPEHLNLVSIQQHKEQIFASRVRSALLYPSIILLVALVVGIGSAWYTLPKLTSVLKDSGGALPLATRIIITAGSFLGHQGIWAIPLFAIVLFGIIFLLFIYNKTKLIGEYIILGLPGVNKLVQGVEVARFGFIFGAMLQAGIPITDALESVREGTGFVVYKKF